MLRTLPSRHFAELEELLPEVLTNSTMVNGLECKLNNRSSKVCLMVSVVCYMQCCMTSCKLLHVGCCSSGWCGR